MKDVIERMLRVEQEARAIIADAEKQAAEIGERGRREASAQAEALKMAAHAESTKKFEAVRAELAAKRQARLAGFDRENEAYAETARPKVPEAAERIVKRVLGG